MQKFKSVFKSKTFWSAIITCIAGWTPVLVASAEKGKLAAADIGSLILVTTGAITTIYFRVAASEELYTPNGLPGANKSDFSQN